MHSTKIFKMAQDTQQELACRQGRSQRGEGTCPPPKKIVGPLLGLGKIGLHPQLGLGFIFSLHN